MTARKILALFFIVIVLAEAKWQKKKREISICNTNYENNHLTKILCYCDKDVLKPEIIKTAECYLTVDGIKPTDLTWDTLDALKSTTRIALTNTRSIPLRYIPTHGLKYLDGVLDIDIKHGNIERVHAFAFANTSTVEDISLRGNAIKILEKHAFAHHRDLAIIKLDKNEIEEINRDVFVDLPFLEKLFLTDNEITTIHDRAFVHLGSLRELEINMNKLYSLNSDTFQGLKNLLKLDLSSNNLQVIGDNTFSPLTSLLSLNLEENRLQILDEKAFYSLNKLQHLSLAHNQLSEIENDLVFVGLVSLKTLNLRANAMRELKTSVMEPILHNFYEIGSYLDVEDNLFPCDCKLDWFLAIMNRTVSKSLKIALENIKCVPDDNLRERWVILEETERSSTQAVDAEDTQSGTEYEYYDESQLNGNLFYTDIRDLIHCGGKYALERNSSTSMPFYVSTRTPAANYSNTTVNPSTVKVPTSSTKASNTPKTTATKLNTPSKPETTSEIKKNITTFKPYVPNYPKPGASDSKKGDTRPYSIQNSGLLDLSKYEPSEKPKEHDERRIVDMQPIHTTAHLVTVSAKPVQKESVYEDMAADEAQPFSLNDQKDKSHPSSAHQNVGCLTFISLLCIRLFH